MCKKKNTGKKSAEWYKNEIRRIDARIERRNKRKNEQYKKLLDTLGVG